MPVHVGHPTSIQQAKSIRTLGGAAGGAGVAAHGDGLLVLLDVLEELDGALELPAVDGLGGLAGVLEGNAQVGAAGAGRLGGLNLGRSVSHLKDKGEISHEPCVASNAAEIFVFRPSWVIPNVGRGDQREGQSGMRILKISNTNSLAENPRDLLLRCPSLSPSLFFSMISKKAARQWGVCTHHLDGLEVVTGFDDVWGGFGRLIWS